MIAIETVVNHIEESFKVTHEMLVNKSRDRDVVEARAIFCKALLDYSIVTKSFIPILVNKNRSMIHHYLKLIEIPEVKKKYNEFCNKYFKDLKSERVEA